MTLALQSRHAVLERPSTPRLTDVTFLAAIWCVNRQWQAVIPDLDAHVTALTETLVIERAREALALALLDAPVQPRTRTLEDIPAFTRRHVPDAARLIRVTPAPVNPLSLELQRVIQASGLSTGELARRLNTGHWVILRMLDPFYWKHSLATLRELADALNLTVQVRLVRADE
ncbi:hypothetical protein DM785_02790 [Deinococcus actinosclerus]|nr:hypothetical protein DM785_02790 [Deinococcus actinosclerus]